MTKKRLLAGLLTLVMLVGMLPTTVLAARMVDDAVPMTPPVEETGSLAAPVWEDAAPSQAQLAEAVDLTNLVNIAKTDDVTVENSGLSRETGYLDTTASHLMDGVVNKDSEYKWVNGGVQAYIDDKGFTPWVSLSFDEPRSVGCVKIFFENDDSQDVTYTYNLWIKESDAADYTKWGENLVATKKSDGYIQTHTFSAMTDITSIKIEFLSAKTANNTTDGAWIVLREVEIYGTAKPLVPPDLSTLKNIAADATLTHSTATTGQYLPTVDNVKNLVDGDYDTFFRWVHGGIQDYIRDQGVTPSVTLNFGENRSIGGFKIGVQKNDGEATQRFAYRILGKAEGATAYTVLASGEATKASNDFLKTYTLPTMTELSSVQVEFTNDSENRWPIFSEIEVLGVAKANPYEGLVEVVQECAVTANGNETNPANLRDGNIKTQWELGANDWPANVDFALPGNLSVKRVEVDFQRFEGRTFDLSISRAVNNVTSDYEQLDRKSDQSVNSTYVLSLDEPQRMTHVRVALHGTNGQAWPAIAEVRIYAVDETVHLEDYEEITAKATRTAGANYVEYDFDANQQIAGFTLTLPTGVTAKLLGKMKRDAGWTTYFAQLEDGANVFRFLQGMSVVRVELSDPSQLGNFKIFGNYTAPKYDWDSKAYDKPTHGNFANSYLVNDGDKATTWRPDMYPAYVDIDLEGTYAIGTIEVYTPTQGTSEYTVYTSVNGRDFQLVGSNFGVEGVAAPSDLGTPADAPDAKGESFSLNGKQAQTVRIYLEYYSEGVKPALNEVRVLSQTAANTNVVPTPEVTITPFEQTTYAAEITEADVMKEVKGIIQRQINAKNDSGVDYTQWFDFALADQSNGYDYFKLEDVDGKIKVTGNNGVSLATGVNHYLKYYCNVHISQVGNQVNMPENVVPVRVSVHKETKYPVRYAYNYCTHSYTMSFWNEAEWRNELDWQALNGVNVVLDITGQEEVWREFLMSVGYTHQEAKDFLAGPGYYAWAYMANLTGFGGPIHDSFLTQRAELGRKNQRIMRTLGMEPALQAFSGMVPVDIATHDPNAAIIPQGVWCSFQRPTMLQTDTATYDKYAAKFYAAQKNVFGDAKYYATDPFHEGGDTGGMSTTVVASAILDSLLDFDSDAVWVIQSWQGNPSTGLLAGLRAGSNPTRTDRRSHAVVLDLYAEKDENWKTYGEDTDGDGLKEFSDTPWVWCMLNNFGGRMGLHGHLDALQKHIPAAANTTKHMVGVGMSPEGAQENPVLYDFLFETVWTDDANQPLPEIDLDQWLKDYVRRRYGAKSENAERAMAILAETVYKDSLNRAGQGSPESVVNGRPSLSGGKASTWGNGSIGYDAVELEKAARLLLADYDALCASDAYLYDLADILKQVLSNAATGAHSKMAAAYRSNDGTFADRAQDFLDLIKTVDEVLSTRTEFTFGKWTGGAELMAKDADDFTKRLYLRNAKALVTTWGSIEQCNAGGLKDYSNRQWAGLTKDFYYGRWDKWIAQAKKNLAAGSTAEPSNSINWFEWEWRYARDPKHYDSDPVATSLQTLGETVLETYGAGEAAFDTRDVDHSAATANAGSQASATGNNSAASVLDNSSSTIWHTPWSPSTVSRDLMWISLDLGSFKTVDGLRYQPRQDQNNGTITGYAIYVSKDGVDWGTPVKTGTWELTTDWKIAKFDNPVIARYVKLVATASQGDFASAAEIRVTGSDTVPVTGITLSAETATLYTNPKSGQSDTLTLTATVTPAEATNKTIVWDSWNPDVATVNNGVVTAVGVDEGRSQSAVTATTEDGSLAATCIVAVRTNLGGSVNITGTPKFGEELDAGLSQVTPASARRSALSYQWKRDGVAITDPADPADPTYGTSATYTVTEADIGKSITVTITAATPCVGELTSPAVTPTKADGPAAPTLTATPVNGATKGTITITDPVADEPDEPDEPAAPAAPAETYEYEYKKTADPDTAWAAVTGKTIGNLDATSYQVRIKENARHLAGEIATVTVTDATRTYFTVSYTVTPAGGATVTLDNTSVEANNSASATVKANPGYVIKSVTVGETALTGVAGVYTVAHVTANTEFKVTAEKIKVTITHDLTNVTCNMAEHDHTVEYGVPFSITLSAAEGYDLPETVTVTTESGAAFHDYEHNGNVLSFTHGITENLKIKGDAKVKSYTVVYTLSHLTADGAPAKVDHGTKLDVTLAAADGYELPDSVTVTVYGDDLTGTDLTDADFTYDKDTGALSIPGAKVTGNVVITATAPDPDVPDEPETPTFSIAANPTKLTAAGQVTLAVTLPEEADTPDARPTVTCDDDTVDIQVTVYFPNTHTYRYKVQLPAVKKTYTFTATLAVGGEEDDLTASCAVEVDPPSKPSSSGTSGSSTTTTTTTNSEGDKVTTVTKPDGTVTETTEKADGTVAVVETKKDGTVTEKVEEADGTKSETVTKPDGSKTATVEQPDGTKSETVVTAEGDATITVTDPEGEELAKVEIPATIPEPETKFEDISTAPWAEEAINNVAGLELVKGIGGNKYDPIAPMTRGSLATVLHRLSQGKTDYDVTFKDVTQGKYYTEGVAWAAKANVVKGISADVFAPDDIITREQLAVMLARYAKLIGMNTKADAKALDKFADGDSTGTWAVDGMAWCVANGILQGKGRNNLDPTANVSRAEVAVMLDRFISLIK